MKYALRLMFSNQMAKTLVRILKLITSLMTIEIKVVLFINFVFVKLTFYQKSPKRKGFHKT